MKLTFAASLVCASAFLPSVVLAQGGETGLQDSVISDAHAACMAIIENGTAAVETLEADGWSADTPEEQPTFDILTGTRDYDGVGELSYYAVIERYPDYTINLCITDVYGSELDFDIARIGDMPELTGTIETYAGRDYGSWQLTGAGHPTMVLAHQLNQDFTYQITQLTDLAGSPEEIGELAEQLGEPVAAQDGQETSPDDRIAALSAQMAALESQVARLTDLLTKIGK